MIEKGKNYGWPIVSEGSHYNDVPIPHHGEKTDFTPPLKFWNPSSSPSGLIFYTAEIQRPQGQRIARRSVLRGVDRAHQGDKVLDDSIVKTARRLRDVAQMPDGSLLLLTEGDNAELLRLTPSSETTG